MLHRCSVNMHLLDFKSVILRKLVGRTVTITQHDVIDKFILCVPLLIILSCGAFRLDSSLILFPDQRCSFAVSGLTQARSLRQRQRLQGINSRND